MKPPIPPPCRIIREGGCGGVCDICGSSLKHRWFGLGKVIGCLQPKCWNWHGWSHLPAGHNRPIDLYGAPEKPPYGLPTPKHYPPMPAVKSPRDTFVQCPECFGVSEHDRLCPEVMRRRSRVTTGDGWDANGSPVGGPK